MNKTCRILWVDDDFSEKSQLKGAMDTHHRHVEARLKQNGITPEITRCVHVKEFLSNAEMNPSYWDVFIIDVNGRFSEQDQNPEDLMYNICREISSYKVTSFCFTGQPHLIGTGKSSNKSLEQMLKDFHFVSKENGSPFWSKNGDTIPMTEKIMELFNEEFLGYDELRYLCRHISPNDKECILQLCRWKKSNGAESFPDHTSLRSVILDRILKEKFRNKTFKDFDESRGGIAKTDIEDWRRFPIVFLTVLNKDAHSNCKSNNHLLNDMIFNAILLFAGWFETYDLKNNFTQENEVEHGNQPIPKSEKHEDIEQCTSTMRIPNPDAKGVSLDWDAGCKCFALGNCVILPKTLLNAINNEVSVSIEVINHTANTSTDTNFQQKYPRFAKKVKLKINSQK